MKIKRIIDRFLNHIINFLIDLRNLLDGKPMGFKEVWDCFKDSKICPVCDGLGILTKDGKSIPS